MPPDSLREHAKYDPRLDIIFSLGHLTLCMHLDPVELTKKAVATKGVGLLYRHCEIVPFVFVQSYVVMA